MSIYVNVDELLDALNSQELADWLDKQEEYTPASIVEHALETLPTVDAIPVEFIESEKQRVQSMIEDAVKTGMIPKAERLSGVIATLDAVVSNWIYTTGTDWRAKGKEE